MTEARDHFEAQGGRDALVEASGVLRTVAVSLYKMANDLRWMSSGPRCGLAEIRLPDLQPGSSIMPGKVNPVVPEAVCQVVAQVIGNDAAVAFGGAAGNLELNVMMPVIARNILESIRLLASVSRALADTCVRGIEADVERCRTYALSSPAIATALNPSLGYERVAEVVKESLRSGLDLRTVVLEMGLMSEEDLDRALDVMAMTRGGDGCRTGRRRPAGQPSAGRPVVRRGVRRDGQVRRPSTARTAASSSVTACHCRGCQPSAAAMTVASIPRCTMAGRRSKPRPLIIARSGSLKVMKRWAQGPRKARHSSLSPATNHPTRQSAWLKAVRTRPAVSMIHALSAVKGSSTTSTS